MSKTNNPNDLVYRTKDGHLRLKNNGEPLYLPISALKSNTPTNSDTPSQRELIPAHIAKIAARLTGRAFGPIIVSWHHGHYWIIDGQQHVEALRSLDVGDVEVLCIVQRGLDVADDADLFTQLNMQKNVTAYTQHMIGVTAGYDRETTVQLIADELGLKIGSTTKADVGIIRGPKTLHIIYDDYGADILERTLRVLRDSFADDSEAYSASMLRGMAMVLFRYSQLDTEELVEKLTRLRRGAIDIASRAVMQRDLYSAQLAHCCAAQIVEVYNKGHRGDKRLPPFPIKRKV